MAKNTKDVYGAQGTTSLLSFDPDLLVLVTDKESPLYDERVHLPIKEEMVLGIMYGGIVQAISVWKNPETGKPEVVSGRQRVNNAREANRRLKEQGRPPVLVPATIKKADTPLALAAVMVMENEHRTQDTPMGRAAKMARMTTFGATEDIIATVFGCSVQTVKSTLALLDCTAAVKKAVDAGQIGVKHAKALAKMEPTEQREKVAELIAAGDGMNGHKKAKAQRAVVDIGPKMRGKKEITAEREAATGERRSALDWVLGLA